LTIVSCEQSLNPSSNWIGLKRLGVRLDLYGKPCLNPSSNWIGLKRFSSLFTIKFDESQSFFKLDRVKKTDLMKLKIIINEGLNPSSNWIGLKSILSAKERSAKLRGLNPSSNWIGLKSRLLRHWESSSAVSILLQTG